MTNQNNIAQAAMQQAVSDDDLLRICQQFNPGQDLDLAKAVRDAVLSKLRAPVADIAAIIRDVCELDPADEGPDTVSVSVTDLRRIIERHSAPVATETLDEGNAPVPLKGHSMGPLTPVCDYTGSLIGQTVATARHGAYEGSVIWVRMLRAGEWMPWRVADKQSAPVAGEPAFYINSSLIDPRTGHIKAEIRDPLTWSDTPVGNWLTPVFIAPVAGERALFALKHIGTWAGIGAGMKTHKEVREYAKHNAQACTPAADMGNPMSIPRVADERAAFEANFPVPVHCQWIGNGYASTEYNAWDAIKHKTRWEGWQARAALASAPVADPETMEEIHRQERERSPWVLPKDPTLPQSAPVAGEAQPEIEQMAVNRYRPVPDGKFSYKVVAGDGSRSLYTGTKDSCLRVAAKLTEAFLDGAFVASDAAPQASAENVRLRELLVRCQAWMLSSEHDRPNMLIALIQDALQSQPQADKDGGQQRAGDAVAAEALAHLRTIANFGGTLDQAKELAARCVWRCAVLSAAQTEQGERDA
ncbi:hypothetical protein [Achromobacter sp. 2789STDY5608628]|uniref:hypothetical protein n=1 Tax=Achromobacter sp. 2789STDY5608628 TaxID=1806493 RepID=UPI0006C455F9|nr:hypothetical protein [Achromobacter sp. 2789STDY5608628]CUJ36521.1 Uncharacterised protein [Achromobacter sp. 2789STDY5608628]